MTSFMQTADTAESADSIYVPLWRVRLRLLWRALKSNWATFAENPIGLIGLGVIIFFGLFASIHPILTSTHKLTFGLVERPIWNPRPHPGICWVRIRWVGIFSAN